MKRSLHAIQESQRGMDVQILETLVRSFTIFEKIEFSPYMSKERIRAKLKDLRERQVPERTVLLSLSDEEVTFYWLKNFIHPDLKHWVYLSSPDKRGCSEQVLLQDAKRDALHYYENGQHYFNYTLEDIEEYLADE